MTTTAELALIESRTLREQNAGRVEVLGKVKALSMLPDDLHVTTEMVANYYEVDRQAIVSLVHDHRAELAGNGYHVVRGDALASLKKASGIASRAPSLGLFTRRALLNVGMVLRDSEIAKQVRSYLLTIEETADEPQRETATDLTALSVAVAQGVTQGLAPVLQSFAEVMARAGFAAPVPDPWAGAPSEPALKLYISSGGKIGYTTTGDDRLYEGEVVNAFLPGETPRQYRVRFVMEPRSPSQVKQQWHWYQMEPVA